MVTKTISLSKASPSWGDYFSLLKPRVMSLVIFTAFVGIMMAPSDSSILQKMLCLLFIALGAGGSGALNMWYDKDIDSLMKRTKGRPLVQGTVSSREAFYLGLFLSIFSVIGLFYVSNPLSAFLLSFTIFFYVVIYSMFLKRSTPQNITIGGAAGAFPPMIAYATQANTISFESIILFLIIFLWTPPHFWVLALDKSEDYILAKVPMLPNTHGKEETLRQSLCYILLLWPITLLPVIYQFWGKFYGVSALVLNTYFTYQFLFYSSKRPMKVFGASIIYLFLIFSCILIDVFIRLAS